MTNNNLNQTAWVSILQAAELFDVPEQTVEKWIRDGKIAARLTPEKHREVLSVNGMPAVMHSGMTPETQPKTEAQSISHQPAPQAQESASTEPIATPANQPLIEQVVNPEPAVQAPTQHQTSTAPPVEDHVHIQDPVAESAPAEQASPSKNLNDQSTKIEMSTALSAVSVQAERSLAAAGAAYQEAKSLAFAYKDELENARKNYQEETKRTRTTNRYAWLSVAFILIGLLGVVIYSLNREREAGVNQQNVTNLRNEIARSNKENEDLKKNIVEKETELKDQRAIISLLKEASSKKIIEYNLLETEKDKIARSLENTQARLDKLNRKLKSYQSGNIVKTGSENLTTQKKIRKLTPEEEEEQLEAERKRVEQFRKDREEERKRRAEKNRLEQARLDEARRKRQEEERKRKEKTNNNIQDLTEIENSLFDDDANPRKPSRPVLDRNSA